MSNTYSIPNIFPKDVEDEIGSVSGKIKKIASGFRQLPRVVSSCFSDFKLVIGILIQNVIDFQQI